MEEAASITKAIETAWARAGQPQEFSIKILEHPKTSFFGLKTAKSAKIAFFFDEATTKIKELPPKPTRTPQATPAPRKPSEYSPQRPQVPQRRPLQQPQQQQSSTPHAENRPAPAVRPQPRFDQRPPRTDSSENRPMQQERPARPEPRAASPSPAPRFAAESRETWTPEMVNAAQEWLKETLVMMGKPDIAIQSQVSYNYLKLTLNQPILDDMRQEDTQLKSWGNLAMEEVRHKTNKPYRNLRLIIESKK